MKGIKGASAHAINKHLGRKGAIWQIESFDHVLRSSESLDAKILYILENPVRQGLVHDWTGYRWLWKTSEILIAGSNHVGTDASSVPSFSSPMMHRAKARGQVRAPAPTRDILISQESPLPLHLTH